MMWDRQEIDMDLMTERLQTSDMINNLEESLGMKLIYVDGWNYKAEKSLTAEQIAELEAKQYETWNDGKNDLINIEY